MKDDKQNIIFIKTAIRDNNPVIFYENKLLYKTKGLVPEEDYIIELGKADIYRRNQMNKKDICELCTEYSADEKCESEDECVLIALWKENRDLKEKIKNLEKELQEAKKVQLK